MVLISCLPQVNSLEVSGPILPGNVLSLCHILRETQVGEFKAVFSTHQSTAAFNRDIADERQEGQTKLDTNTATLKEHIQLLKKPCQLEGQSMKEIACADRLYSWDL